MLTASNNVTCRCSFGESACGCKSATKCKTHVRGPATIIRFARKVIEDQLVRHVAIGGMA